VVWGRRPVEGGGEGLRFDKGQAEIRSFGRGSWNDGQIPSLCDWRGEVQIRSAVKRLNPAGPPPTQTTS